MSYFKKLYNNDSQLIVTSGQVVTVIKGSPSVMLVDAKAVLDWAHENPNVIKQLYDQVITSGNSQSSQGGSN